MIKIPDGVQCVSLDALIPYVNNARTHDDEQVAMIAASIKEFGFNNPVLVDDGNGIIAGHGRVLAAKKLGMDEVPVVYLSHLTDAQRRAYILADNRLAEKSDWDMDLVKAELDFLQDDGFDVELTGFDLDVINMNDAEIEFPDLPDGDRSSFQQMSFQLHDEQAAIVQEAISLAKKSPLIDTGLNTNGNANALAFICQEWMSR